MKPEIDLRSDTVTRPSAGMLDAMFSARVGDDVFSEDPTTKELEEKIAGMFGMEAAVFCPSGTMTNQIAIKVHTQPGDEVICDATSHIYNYEGGGISVNSLVQAKLLAGDRGRLNAEQIEQAINPVFDWLTRTRLVSLENTVNRSGGSYYRINGVKPIYDLCKKHKLALHLDGARLFNAFAETGERPEEWGSVFDSISICFSKGLGAPVGSALLGGKEFIKEARRVRKRMGGGMRQSGLLSAACIYALDNNISRLKEDHRKAKILETALSALPYVNSVMPCDTNIVLFTIKDSLPAEKFVQILAENCIKAVTFGKQTVRFVTHLDFSDEMLEKVLEVLKNKVK